MAMAWIWTIIICFSLAYGAFSGNITQVSAAAAEGSAAAVKLCIEILGITCLWSGVMEVMKRAGIADKLASAFRPLLSRLFPSVSKTGEAMRAISANVSANLLGLGNAATPLGIRAAEEMAKTVGGGTTNVATDDLCMLVVINTASIQLIPATVAAVRAAAGAAAPFDILPAVWVTSAASVTMGVLAAKVLSRVWRRRATQAHNLGRAR
ncbi:MAG: spore maturation protein A [Oscillospiraceae bacterium]|jgi:spore maturation protein A|nr:spore maturation protein A [Oscillospiraceae bacterium]